MTIVIWWSYTWFHWEGRIPRSYFRNCIIVCWRWVKMAFHNSGCGCYRPFPKLQRCCNSGCHKWRNNPKPDLQWSLRHFLWMNFGLSRNCVIITAGTFPINPDITDVFNANFAFLFFLPKWTRVCPFGSSRVCLWMKQEITHERRLCILRSLGKRKKVAFNPNRPISVASDMLRGI